MAFTILKNSGAKLFVTDSGGVSRELTAYWLSGGPTLNVDMVEVTALVDNGQKIQVGLQRNEWDMEILYEDTATTGSWAVLNGRFGENTVRNNIWHPSGNAAGKPRITVPCLMETLRFGGRVGEFLPILTHWRGDATVTIDTN